MKMNRKWILCIFLSAGLLLFMLTGCSIQQISQIVQDVEQGVNPETATQQKETAGSTDAVTIIQDQSSEGQEADTEEEKEEKEEKESSAETPENAPASQSEKQSEKETVPASEPAPAAQNTFVNDHVVAIDPGHQGSHVDMSAPEPIAPGSSETKQKATTGTMGTFSGVPEYELNLQIGLKLRDILESRGYEVIMTREDNDTAISNSERAILAAEKGAEISVRIHANGSDDPGMQGALGMTMSRGNPYVGYLFDESYSLAQNIMNHYCEKTGFQNLGIQFYDDMTGFNWSTIPVMIIEMGFMTNEHDDLAMNDEETRGKMAEGIADGIDSYFGIDTSMIQSVPSSETESVSKEDETEEENSAGEENDPIQDIYQQYIAARESMGEQWAVCVEPLNSEKVYAYNSDASMLTASVLKVFIMGAVYDRICYPESEETEIPYEESYEGELRSLLESMITVSDNDAANRLTEILGQGDIGQGMYVVNDFCLRHGYEHTSMGRRFLEENPSGDNYTSAGDCCKILADIYKGRLVNEEASEKMLTILKGQTRTHKIPAGLPMDFTSANKTGEMPEGYGLGCIENDMAVIFSPAGDYVLVVLSQELGGRNDQAQDVIRQISSYTASWKLGQTGGSGSSDGASQAEMNGEQQDVSAQTGEDHAEPAPEISGDGYDVPENTGEDHAEPAPDENGEVAVA